MAGAAMAGSINNDSQFYDWVEQVRQNGFAKGSQRPQNKTVETARVFGGARRPAVWRTGRRGCGRPALGQMSVCLRGPKALRAYALRAGSGPVAAPGPGRRA